jgi:2-amino-4,5-dihydroxy-6-oxo-7-(phosphonooxy)heptanoate synthase
MMVAVSPVSGKALRLMRLRASETPRLFVLPMDHSVTDGPIDTPDGIDRLIAMTSQAGVDAYVLHKGRVASVRPERWRSAGMIVQLSGSTRHAADPDAKVLVASVEDAVRLDADAVTIHVNVGSATEPAQLRDMARVVADCGRWQIPLLAMLYPRGPKVSATDPDAIAHCATLAAELGADVVKVPYTGEVGSMRDVVADCPIPVLAAGGPRLADLAALERFVGDVAASGAAGVAAGRNIFSAQDPAEAARRVATVLRAAPARAPEAALTEVGA